MGKSKKKQLEELFKDRIPYKEEDICDRCGKHAKLFEDGLCQECLDELEKEN